MKRALCAPLVALGAAALVLGGLVPAHASTTTVKSASEVLASLAVAAPQNSSTYQRADFYTDWADADGDGYNTRAEVLMASSTAPVTYNANGTTVATGSWLSWYDGGTTTLASDLQIDHLVPLAEAWRSGAWSWSAAQRGQYANDLSTGYSLQAVTASVNERKGDKDPAQWMPPAAASACRYDQDWVLVKYKWNLSVDQAERDAIATQFAKGGCGAQQLTLPAKGGTAAVAGGTQRLSGADRYATAVALSRASFGPGVPVVFVANGLNYPDALSAASAAAVLGGPLLLTGPTSLPASVATELKRLEPQSIIVVGGTGAVSARVAGQLEAYSPSIERASGADRYATSRAIAKRAFPTASTVFVATGRSFPDALSASAAAGAKGAPVVLVDGAKSGLDAASAAAIKAAKPARIVVAGGTGAVSSGVAAALARIAPVSRYGGSDRYATANSINAAFFPTAATAYLASGTSFPDALAGAAVAGRAGAPLFIVQPSCVPDASAAALAKAGVGTRVVLGGTGAVSAAAASGLVCSKVPKPKPPVVKPKPPVTAPKPPVTAPKPPVVAPKPTPKPTQTTKPAPPPSTYYANCAAVRAAGKAPIYAGQPGYSRKLDRDGDGIACE